MERCNAGAELQDTEAELGDVAGERHQAKAEMDDAQEIVQDVIMKWRDAGVKMNDAQGERHQTIAEWDDMQEILQLAIVKWHDAGA